MSLDGFSTEHQPHGGRSLQAHSRFRMAHLFPPTILSLIYIIFSGVLNAAELYSGKRQCLSVGKSQITEGNVSTTFRIVP